ncbi:MAG: hypothetical protein HY216_00205 [Candidatus Rokubacteria bacterium]|nr:hypothetical protein [Candidatus Rokubacteria bacterium]
MLIFVATAGAADEAREAVDAFLSRLAVTPISDLFIEQQITLYHSDGRQVQSRGEQRLAIRVPRRLRLEQTIDGARDIRLSVDDRTWIKNREGKVVEAPPGDRARARTYLITPFRRTVDDLLAEWRAFGVRTDVIQQVEVRRRPVVVVGAGPDDRQSPAVWIDRDYGVIRFIAREELPRGPALIDLAFSEHRLVTGGFYFPYRQEAFTDGRLLVLVTVRSVHANTGLADSLFDPEALKHER